MKATPARLALVMSAAPGFPAWARLPAGSEGISGLHPGSDLREHGEHGVVPDIAVSDFEGRTELCIDGTLGFGPVLAGANREFADAAGSFAICGFLLTKPRGVNNAGHIELQREAWLPETGVYGSASFHGQAARHDSGLRQIAGTPLAGPKSELCSDLIAPRSCHRQRIGDQ